MMGDYNMMRVRAELAKMLQRLTQAMNGILIIRENQKNGMTLVGWIAVGNSVADGG